MRINLDDFRLAASTVDKILKWTKPGDLALTCDTRLLTGQPQLRGPHQLRIFLGRPGFLLR